MYAMYTGSMYAVYTFHSSSLYMIQCTSSMYCKSCNISQELQTICKFNTYYEMDEYIL